MNSNHLIFNIKSSANCNIWIVIIIIFVIFCKMEKLLFISHEIWTKKGQKITKKKTTIRLLKVMRGRREIF